MRASSGRPRCSRNGIYLTTPCFTRSHRAKQPSAMTTSHRPPVPPAHPSYEGYGTHPGSALRTKFSVYSDTCQNVDTVVVFPVVSTTVVSDTPWITVTTTVAVFPLCDRFVGKGPKTTTEMIRKSLPLWTFERFLYPVTTSRGSRGLHIWFFNLTVVCVCRRVIFV